MAVTRTVVGVPEAMLVGVSCTVPMLGAAQAQKTASSRPASERQSGQQGGEQVVKENARE
jgi:hypothetical protein